MDPDDFNGNNAIDAMNGDLPLFQREWRIQDLSELVEELEKDMEQGKFRTRREVVDGILKPLFAQLGWDFADADRVVRRFETATGSVDFALCLPDGDPRVLVSIDPRPDPDGEDAHPFDDLAIPAIQLSVSEDGRLWRLHCGAGRGSVRNREFARFEIVSDPARMVAEILETFLAHHAIKSGEALREAARDYGAKRFPAEALAAWRRSLLAEEAVERFLAEMKKATGVLPDLARAEAFVHGQVDAVPWPADPPDPTPSRRVALGDRVWFHDFASGEIVTKVVVGGEADFERGEVTRDSSVGHALLGAREGEEREMRVPGEAPKAVRIVLIRGRDPD